MEVLKEENRELRRRVCRYESAERGGRGSGGGGSDAGAVATFGADCDGDDDDDEEDDGYGNDNGDDDADGDDGLQLSEVLEAPRLWTTRASVAAAAAPCFATAFGNPSTVATAPPGSRFYGKAMPAPGPVSSACGTAFGAARGESASFNMISRPAVFA